MRIIGGKYKSRILSDFPGKDVRPTSDRVKESLFNIISLKLYGARVLDLFSGSGALGIESLSRGAKEVVFNDCAKQSVGILKKNLSTLKVEEGVRVLNYDFEACLKSVNGPFDIIFLDPPYRFDYGKTALEKIVEYDLLAESGLAVYERDRAFDGEIAGLEKYDERKYGKTYLTFFKKKV